jgi:spore coat protein U-like protein
VTRLRKTFAALGLFATLLCFASAGQAQTCTPSITDINFGSVSLRAGVTNQTIGSVSISCSGGLLGGAAVPVGVCLTFGGGSASNNAVPPRRFMVGPSGSFLEYQLRQYGNGASNGTLVNMYIAVPIVLGSGSAMVPIYADIISNSVDVPTGAYSANFTGVNGVQMKVGVLSCDILSTSQTVPSFQVSATVAASCEVDTGNLDFGNIGGPVTTTVDQSTSINVRCTNGTPYRVSLGLGEGSGATGPTSRKMRNLSSFLTYGLYQDPGRSIPWGDNVGNNVARSGNGGNQALAIYGRVFPGQTTAIGVYTDRILVTINY